MRIYLSLLIIFFASLPNQLFALTDEAVEEITERLESSTTDELIERLKERGHDKEFINKRMDLANLQRSKISEFDYVVKNVDINTTVKEILDIICNLEESW